MSVDTPIGIIELTADDDALCSALFIDEKLEDMPSEFLGKVKQSLKTYFSTGKLTVDFPMNPSGTDFQKEVWNALKNIPNGETISYLDLAMTCGGKTYTRAVASANGKNPISIFIPCHRVIGSDGSLTGYAGGLNRKKYLLELEGAMNQLTLF